MPELNLSFLKFPEWMVDTERPGVPSFLESRQDNRAQAMSESQLKTAQLQRYQMGQESRMNELKIAQQLEQRNQMLQAQEAMVGLNAQVSELLAQDKPEEAGALALSYGVKNPVLLNAPPFLNLLNQTKQAAQAKMMLENYRSMEQRRLDQTANEAERNSQLHELRLLKQNDVDGGSEKTYAPTTLGRYIKERDAAKAQGMTDVVAAYDELINNLSRPLKPARLSETDKIDYDIAAKELAALEQTKEAKAKPSKGVLNPLTPELTAKEQRVQDRIKELKAKMDAIKSTQVKAQAQGSDDDAEDAPTEEDELPETLQTPSGIKFRIVK